MQLLIGISAWRTLHYALQLRVHPGVTLWFLFLAGVLALLRRGVRRIVAFYNNNDDLAVCNAYYSSYDAPPLPQMQKCLNCSPSQCICQGCLQRVIVHARLSLQPCFNVISVSVPLCRLSTARLRFCLAQTTPKRMA